MTRIVDLFCYPKPSLWNSRPILVAVPDLDLHSDTWRMFSIARAYIFFGKHARLDVVPREQTCVLEPVQYVYCIHACM
jgi:hypothetical protein